MGNASREKGCVLQNTKFYIRDQSSVANRQQTGEGGWHSRLQQVMDVGAQEHTAGDDLEACKDFGESGEFPET
jgi:hypothetical protein